MSQDQTPQRLGDEPGGRKFELIDFDDFSKSDKTGEEAPPEQQEAAPVSFTASGRQIWAWESVSSADTEDAGKTAEAEAAEAAPDTEPESAAAPERTARSREVSPAASYQFYRKSVKKTQGRVRLAFVLCLPSLYLTLASVLGWPIPSFLTDILRYVLAGLLGLQLLVCYDVPVRAVYHLSAGRMRLELLTLLVSAACILDAALGPAGYTGYCAVPMLGLWMSLWGLCLRSVALRRSAKIAAGEQTPFAAVTVANLWNGLHCLVKLQAPVEGFITDLEKPDHAEQVMGVYAPIAAAAALIFSLIATLHTGGRYLSNAAILLCGALPIAGALSYARPFARLALRLQHAGAALSGWTGAQTLRATDALVLTDQDLFPSGTVTQTGVKVFGDYTPAQVISYAAAVLRCEGGGLYDVFQGLLSQAGGQEYASGEYRAYEGGGLGAEVRSNIVLVGSLDFMRLMGVALPAGAAVRQAVYVSLNGVLAGLVAMQYTAASPVRTALLSLQDIRGLRAVLATRDFLITPAALHQCFRLQSDRFFSPTMADRLRLSSLEAPEKALRAAILGKDSLSALVKTIAGGRQLCRLVRANVLINLLGGVLGLLLLFYLAFSGSVHSLTPLNLVLYAVIWAIPPLLLSSWAGDWK